MESYLRRWARVAGVVRSLTATNSISGFPRALRKTLRPMRPKPLMPTFTAAMISVAPIVYCERDLSIGIEERCKFAYGPSLRMLTPAQEWRKCGHGIANSKEKPMGG